MIRGFSTPKEKEVSAVTIAEKPEVISVLEEGILEPGIVQ